jgi:hypothetical protein
MASAIGPSFLPLRLYVLAVFIRGAWRLMRRGIHRKHVGVKRMHFPHEAVDAMVKKTAQPSG